MKKGDEVLLKGKVIDFDSNPHGASIKVRLNNDSEVWVHRLKVDETIVIKEQ
jgi:hypothetical protein